MLHAVVLAGGVGSRLWPESTPERPKPFLRLSGNRTMLGETVGRLERLVPPERILIVTGESFAPLVRESFPGISPNNLLLEPVGRNTAAGIGLAAVRILRDDPEATLAVLPADHRIEPADAFCRTLRFATDLVEENPERLITLGVKPSFPATSYGYIQRSEPLTGPAAEKWASLCPGFEVKAFREKPPLDEAKRFFDSGEFLWNAGIFVWKAKTILERLKAHEPEIARRLETIADHVVRPDFLEILRKEFSAMPNLPIDRAVLEKTAGIVVLEAPFVWDDLGTWGAIDRVDSDKKDQNGNLPFAARIVAVDSRNNFVRSDDPEHLFALVGVEDLIVVQSGNTTLIVRKDREESVREVLEQLKKS